jgi:hypothetical protein
MINNNERFGENKQKQHKTIMINAENDDKQS